MKVLLDTHAFLWWDNEPTKLTATALATLQNKTIEVLVSVASIWEIQIKVQIGKLTLHRPLADIVAAQQANGLTLLPILLDHVLRLDTLPAYHKDPFDRMLAAQANVEPASLLSADPVFAHYPVTVVW